jgi:hypothetical protein
MKAIEKKELVSLKAAIKGSALEATLIRKNLIHPKKGLERARGWTEKRGLGTYARVLLLSYGLMRGFEFKRLEPNHQVFTPLEISFLAKQILQVCNFYGPFMIKYHCKELSVETITLWLKGGENVLFKYVPKTPKDNLTTSTMP